MKPRVPRTSPTSLRRSRIQSRYHHFRRRFFDSSPSSFIKGNGGSSSSSTFRASFSSSSSGGSSSGSSSGNPFIVPGATVATILMLGALHARRMYEDKKVEEARARGIDTEFQPDFKASFLNMLPLRSISRMWGSLTSMELPVWSRSFVYKAWARAFHTNLKEVALPLEDYASLQQFFSHGLTEGSRPIEPDPYCLVSPVDGIVMRYGELKGAGAMIEQVKGYSYPVLSLLGRNSFLPMAVGDTQDEVSSSEVENNSASDQSRKSWWKVSLASPKAFDSLSTRPMKGVFYCVLYLSPGDYHRVHSPADWNVLVRRHFSGRLFPVNERAARTIRNLYAENERVVLEGQWQQGYMALAAVGATNIGSIELFIEPELRTNLSRKKLLPSEPPEERVYEPDGVGVFLRKGDQLAAFRMGSTVILVFQAPMSKLGLDDDLKQFQFSVRRGDKIRVGQAIGRCG